MRKTTSGFTLVELMIVIVSIGILATIGIISYNGITDRARNGQTVNAAEQWIKALQIFRARTGQLPA
jgi:general secretion pathway protein G